MKDVFIVGLGGFLGSASRYGVSLFSSTYFTEKSYIGTLLVNLVGCFIIGILSGILTKSSNQVGLFLMVGLCGGFTTFSSFALDGIKLIKDGLIGQFLIYSSISLIGGLILCLLGIFIVK